MSVMRLQRALARAGIASRRKSEDLIRAGRVRINGQVATIGTSVDTEKDIVTVGGRRVRPTPVTWIALHKPVGYVVTRHDPRGRPTVFELVPRIPGLTYVGRLDVMTSGLLLLTTDGLATNRLMHPRYGVERSYCVLVHGKSHDAITRALREPLVVDRRPVRVLQHRVRAIGEHTSEVTLSLAEGRYRIVRRLCTRLGLKVERLVRLSYGPVRLGSMAVGKWRHLSTKELHALRAASVATVS